MENEMETTLMGYVGYILGGSGGLSKYFKKGDD